MKYSSDNIPNRILITVFMSEYRTEAKTMDHKKVIVPVVALMLSLVALAGIGLAYTGIYTDSIDDTDTTSAYVQVGGQEKISIPLEGTHFKYDTKKIGPDGVRTYRFSTENNMNDPSTGKTITVGENGETLTLTWKLATIVVTVGEVPATGTLDVELSPISDDRFVKSITVDLADNTFDLEPGEGTDSKSFDVYATIEFTSLNIRDSADSEDVIGVDDLVIPGFEMTATANTHEVVGLPVMEPTKVEA